MGRGLIEEGYRFKLTLKPMVSYYILSIIIWKGSACGFRALCCELIYPIENIRFFRKDVGNVNLH